MSVNIYTDRLQHANLFGKDVLCTNWLIPRDAVPKGWYCYDVRQIGSQPVELVDQAAAGHMKTVLSPLPLKEPNAHSRKVGDAFYLHGEEMALADYCEDHGLECPVDDRKFVLRPASPDEAGLFYAQHPSEDERLGCIGHIRMDFGRSGNEFWHTWWPRGPEEWNNPEFKAELQEVVDELRQSVLKNRFAMERFCYGHGGKINGGWVQNYGYIVETGNYRYCLRCNPSPGDYNGYLTAFDLRIQQMHQRDHLVGRVSYASGEKMDFTDGGRYLQTIREELPYHSTTGFHFETLTNDPTLRKAVDDILLDFAGERNPRRTCNYGLTAEGQRQLQSVADPSIPHQYEWFVITEINTSKEQNHRGLTLEEAIQVYEESEQPEKRLGVTKDGIATVDIVHTCEGEQQFFENHKKLASFQNDSTIVAAIEVIRERLGQDLSLHPMPMGGI